MSKQSRKHRYYREGRPRVGADDSRRPSLKIIPRQPMGVATTLTLF